MPRLRPPPRAPLSERQRVLWDGMHAFTRNHGGSITSAPYASPIRLECSPTSGLPEKLRGYGYKLAEVGSAARMLPVSKAVAEFNSVKKVRRDSVEPTMVSIYEFDLPSR